MTQRATGSASAAAWSYTAGQKGRNRVRVFLRRAVIWIDYKTEDGGRVRHSLSHADRDRAKREADEIAAKFGRAESRPRAALTLRRLIDIYEREVTKTKSPSAAGHDRRTLPLFMAAFGVHRRPETLNQRDWDSYIQRRRRGEIAPPGREGKHVRARVLEQDLKLLSAVLNWATRSRDDAGQFMLDRNPLRGLAIPHEESPVRPQISLQDFQNALRQAKGISALAELFVALLWHTGHRAASVRQLRWADIDVEGAAVLWRADVDKIGYEHRNPLHPELLPLLARGKAVAQLTGDVWLFPNPSDGTKPMAREQASGLWRAIADAAGLPKGVRLGTHSFRRAFANRLRNVSLRELKDLGGWKTQETVVSVYLQPDQEAQRRALTGASKPAPAE